MAKRQTTKKRFEGMVEESQDLLWNAHGDVSAFKHSIEWLNLYIAVVESVEKFTEFLAAHKVSDLDDDDKAMIDRLEEILGVLK